MAPKRKYLQRLALPRSVQPTDTNRLIAILASMNYKRTHHVRVRVTASRYSITNVSAQDYRKCRGNEFDIRWGQRSFPTLDVVDKYCDRIIAIQTSIQARPARRA